MLRLVLLLQQVSSDVEASDCCTLVLVVGENSPKVFSLPCWLKVTQRGNVTERDGVCFCGLWWWTLTLVIHPYRVLKCLLACHCLFCALFVQTRSNIGLTSWTVPSWQCYTVFRQVARLWGITCLHKPYFGPHSTRWGHFLYFLSNIQTWLMFVCLHFWSVNVVHILCLE